MRAAAKRLRMGDKATELASKQNSNERPVNSLRRCNRQSNERDRNTGSEPIQKDF
jgi:hypothetical protein